MGADVTPGVGGCEFFVIYSIVSRFVTIKNKCKNDLE
jgi:hypothetical protein